MEEGKSKVTGIIWSDGVMEYWSDGVVRKQYSNTPSLYYSNTTLNNIAIVFRDNSIKEINYGKFFLE